MRPQGLETTRTTTGCSCPRTPTSPDLAFVHGPPPKVTWLRITNTSTAQIEELLAAPTDPISALAGNGSDGVLVLRPLPTAADNDARQDRGGPGISPAVGHYRMPSNVLRCATLRRRPPRAGFRQSRRNPLIARLTATPNAECGALAAASGSGRRRLAGNALDRRSRAPGCGITARRYRIRSPLRREASRRWSVCGQRRRSVPAPARRDRPPRTRATFHRGSTGR